MSTSPYLTTTQESNEDAEYNKICKEFEHLMETIPKGNGWMEKHLYNYNGFWLHPNSIKNNLILHTYFRSQPTDIFLASKWHFMSNHRSKDLPPLLLEDAFELFCERISDYGPLWEHVLSYWRASLEFPEKTLFLKYEEIKEQPEVVLRKLAAFMGKPFTAEEVEKGVVERIVELCSFENLSNLEENKKGVEKSGKFLEVENRHFFRKGKIGDWRNYLSEEMRKRIDGITHDKLKGSGLILGASFE